MQNFEIHVCRLHEVIQLQKTVYLYLCLICIETGYKYKYRCTRILTKPEI
jgi:hypothetical protein